MAKKEIFDIWYMLSGGQPPVTAQLHISEEGQAELYLGSSYSAPNKPLDQVGFFGGTVEPAKLARLNQYIADQQLMSHASGEPAESPDPAMGYVTLTQGSQKHQLILSNTANDPALARLEEMLIEILASLTGQPRRVAQVTLSPAVENGAVKPTVKITNIGDEPLPILLFDPKEMGTFLKIQLAVMEPAEGERLKTVSSANISRDDIAALVKAGAIPEGVQKLAPGQAYTFSLPSLPGASGNELQLGGTFTFWLPGSGPELRLVYVQAQRVPLESE